MPTPISEIALNDENDEIRATAARALVKLRVPGLLLPAFTDATPTVRLIAVDGVSELIDEIGADGHSTSAHGSFLRCAAPL